MPSRQKILNSKFYVYTMIIFAAIVSSITMNFFISLAAILPSGLMSIVFVFSFIWTFLSKYITIIYLALNIPLLMFFWKKIKSKKYLYRTTLFLVVQAAFGSLFLIKPFANFLIDSTIFKYHTAEQIRVESPWLIIVFAIVGGTLIGWTCGIAWKFSGSTGGTDIIIYYISNTRKKPLGSISKFVGMFLSAFSFSFSIIFNESMRELWIFVLLGTLIYVYIYSTIIDLVYPKYSKVRVEIFSNKVKEIEEELQKQNFPHPWYRHNVIKSGNQSIKNELITCTTLLLEVRHWTSRIIEIDPDVSITIIRINSMQGYFDTRFVDETVTINNKK